MELVGGPRCSLSFCCPTRVKTCGSLGARAEDGRLVDLADPQGWRCQEFNRIWMNFGWSPKQKDPVVRLPKLLFCEESAILKHSKKAMQMGFRTRFMCSTLANKSPMAEPNLGPKRFFFHGEKRQGTPISEAKKPMELDNFCWYPVFASCSLNIL